MKQKISQIAGENLSGHDNIKIDDTNVSERILEYYKNVISW